jgi:uncharacterized protein (UPF0303 family)
MTDLIATLTQQEDELVFDSFDLDQAWLLGIRITETARSRGVAAGIEIRRPGFVMFRSSLPGITADQDTWLARKAAVVLRMEKSSALVEAEWRGMGIDPFTGGWLGEEYAVTGGSFPIRVRGAGVVAAISAAGELSSMGDHDLIVDGIRAHLAEGPQ